MTQLRFDALLGEADTDNQISVLRARYPHLPVSRDEAVSHFRALLEQCNAAFLAADADRIRSVYDEADALAIVIQGSDFGIFAADGAGTRLAAETRAWEGTIPQWGQTGDFIVEASGLRVRIETDGIFGIATGFQLVPGFAAHAVDFDRPFISETGFYSLLGIVGTIEHGVTIDAYARSLIEHMVARKKLVPIQDKYRERAAQEQTP